MILIHYFKIPLPQPRLAAPVQPGPERVSRLCLLARHPLRPQSWEQTLAPRARHCFQGAEHGESGVFRGLRDVFKGLRDVF